MLPFRAVLRGSLVWFLPASLASIGLLLVGLGVPLAVFATDPYPLQSAKMAVALTVGYFFGLEIMRRRVPLLPESTGKTALNTLPGKEMDNACDGARESHRRQ